MILRDPLWVTDERSGRELCLKNARNRAAAPAIIVLQTREDRLGQDFFLTPMEVDVIPEGGGGGSM